MISIQEFYEEFIQEILSNADVEGKMTETTFLENICEMLAEEGELSPDWTLAYYSKIGIEVAGGDFDEERKIQYLFNYEFFNTESIQNFTKTMLETKYKRVVKFFEKSVNKLYAELEETADEYSLAFNVYQRYSNKEIDKLVIIILTDGKLNNNALNLTFDNSKLGVEIELKVIDVEYMYKTYQSKFIEGDYEIDVDIPYLEVNETSEYEGYLAVINGEEIFKIYDTLGKKVLEENVRTFLQFKGKINKGIRNTIEKAPEYFFAYNNGITATARSIKFNKNKNKIISIKNFQIVNGGQTTSSIYVAKKMHNIDVSKVFVQLKLSLIKDKEKYESFVKNISKYANTQNKVNDSDFFSNHRFHKEFSDFSKRIWAPAKVGTYKKTRWFYERVRGEYLNDQATLKRAEKTVFQLDCPKSQVIDKVFLAKSENLWQLKPVEVCKGAQYSFKTFAEYTSKEYEKEDYMITEIFYKSAIARAIIFKQLEKLISKSIWYTGGYRAQTVAYTIAYIANMLKKEKKYLNFELIWQEQSLRNNMLTTLNNLAVNISLIIVKPGLGCSNVGEWCKRSACWNTIKDLNLELNIPKEYIIDNITHKEIIKMEKKEEKEEKKINYLVEICNIEIEKWKEIYQHYSKYNELTETQLDLIRKIANGEIENGYFYPSDKQSKIIYNALKIAKSEGII